VITLALVFLLGCFIGACGMLGAALFLATAPDRGRPDWSDGSLPFKLITLDRKPD